MSAPSSHDAPARSASPPVLVAYEVHHSTNTNSSSHTLRHAHPTQPPPLSQAMHAHATIISNTHIGPSNAAESPVLTSLRPTRTTSSAASPTANSFTVTTTTRGGGGAAAMERDPSILFASEVSSYRGTAPLFSTFVSSTSHNNNNNGIKGNGTAASNNHLAAHATSAVAHRGSWGTSTPLAALGKLTAARKFFALPHNNNNNDMEQRSSAAPVFISAEVVHGSAGAADAPHTRELVTSTAGVEEERRRANDTRLRRGAPSWLRETQQQATTHSTPATTARTPAEAEQPTHNVTDVAKDNDKNNVVTTLPTLRRRSTRHRGRHKHRHRTNSSSSSSSDGDGIHGHVGHQETTPRRRTRNANALYAMPWDQRPFLPTTSNAWLQPVFAVLASPRFWEKLDWAVRASWFTVLPTMILTLEPATQHLFPIPSAVANLAYWITMPTFGAGLRELYFALKGFGMCLVLLFIVIALKPGQSFGTLVLFFVETFIAAFVAEEVRATATYCLCTYIMQYLTDPAGTGYAWAAQYFLTLLIALGFGLAAFLIPFIRWSSAIAEHYIKVYGNSLAYAAETLYTNFWALTSLDRELAKEHVAQLLRTAEECVPRIETALSESEYEPHSGLYLARLNARYALLRQLYKVLAAGQEVIVAIVASPESVHGPMSGPLGVRIAPTLRAMAENLATMVMRVADLSHVLQMSDIDAFRTQCDEFEQFVHDVQDDVVTSLAQANNNNNNSNSNEDEYYRAGRADVLVGVFLFNLARACEVVTEHAAAEVDAARAIAAGGSWTRHFILYRSLFWWRDVRSAWAATKTCALRFHRRGALTRRFKEAVKMALCMFVAGTFQNYALRDSPTSAAAGAAVIAQLYSASGGESFQYASGRLMGTVLGSVVSLMIVQLASGRLAVLYSGIALLGFAGAYVQAAPGFYPVGNTIVGGLISVITAYTDSTVALVSIQQNVFASLLYFAVAFLVWPVRSRTRVRVELDLSLRYTRDAIRRLLRNVDLPNSVDDVVTDVRLLLSSWSERVRLLENDLPRGQSEPTITSVAFPLAAWTRVVAAQKTLLATAWVMLDAYRGFMHNTNSSNSDNTVIVMQDGQMVLSVHWVLLHRIAPEAIALADALSDTIELFLQSLASATVGSNEVLTQLQRRMRRAQRRMLRIFSDTLQVRVPGVSHVDENDEEAANAREPIKTISSVRDDTAPLPTTTTTRLHTVPSHEVQGSVASFANFSGSHGAGRLRWGRSGNASASTAATTTTMVSASAANGPRMTYHIRPEERQMLRELLQNVVATLPGAEGMQSVSQNHSFTLATPPTALPPRNMEHSTTTVRHVGSNNTNEPAAMVNANSFWPDAVRQNAVMLGPVSVMPDVVTSSEPVFTGVVSERTGTSGVVVGQSNGLNVANDIAEVSMRTMSQSRAEGSRHPSQGTTQRDTSLGEHHPSSGVSPQTTDLLLAGGRRSRSHTQGQQQQQQPLLLQLAQQQLCSTAMPSTTTTTLLRNTVDDGSAMDSHTAAVAMSHKEHSITSDVERNDRRDIAAALHAPTTTTTITIGPTNGVVDNNEGSEDFVASSSHTHGLGAALRHAWRRLREEANAAPHQAFQNARQRRMHGGRHNNNNHFFDSDEEDALDGVKKSDLQANAYSTKEQQRRRMRSSDITVHNSQEEEEHGPPVTPALVTPLHPGLRAGGSVDEALPLQQQQQGSSPNASTLSSSSLPRTVVGPAASLNNNTMMKNASYAAMHTSTDDAAPEGDKEVHLAQVQRELNYRDLHSIEAFLFGISLLVENMNELQHAMLDMQYASEMARKL